MARQAFKPTPADSRLMVQLPDSVNNLPDTVSVDLDSDDDNNFEIVTVDDTPEDDRGRPTEWTGGADKDDKPNGKSDYQKRINRLKAETETERRGREARERELEEASRVIQAQNAELADLRKRSEAGGAALAASMKSERENKLADAKRRLSAAHADGDSEAIAQATEDMSTASAELAQIIARTPAPRPAGEPERQPTPQPQRQQAPANLTPDTVAWLAHNNSWWGHDKARTEFALSLDRTLKSRGVNPGTPDYTVELDKGMAAMYADHKPYRAARADDGADDNRQERSDPRRTNVVDRGSRDNDSNRDPRRVELTASEVSLANRMRIPLKTYAAEKLRRQQRENGGA